MVVPPPAAAVVTEMAEAAARIAEKASTVLTTRDPLTAMGLVAAVVAVLADLAVGFAEVGREMAGEPTPGWAIQHIQGPLTGFALAAPAAYILCHLVL